MIAKEKRTIEKFWTHPEYGDVEVVSAGNFPDTLMVKCLEGEFSGDTFQVYLTDLISTKESSAALDILLSGMRPGKG